MTSLRLSPWHILTVQYNQFCVVQQAECALEDVNVLSILRKIVKIVTTRCQIVRLICTKFDFGLGSPPKPARGVVLGPFAALKGPTSKF